MTRIVYIHHLSHNHNLEDYIKDAFAIKKVFACDDGEMLYQGMPVPFSFFDYHADVVITSLPMHLHKAFVDSMPHIPTVGINGYCGIYATGKHRDIWRSHAKNKGIKVPHVFSCRPDQEVTLHEMKQKVFLPSKVRTASGACTEKPILTFPELQEYISALNEPAHIERHMEGDHVYIVSIKDFRDHDTYTTPLLHKTDHGYKVCGHIKDEQKEDAARFAKELHDELGLGPVAQFEFVIKHNDLYLVHIEPNPDHTDNSALHAGLASVGSSMKELWKTIIENARKKK